MSGILAQGARFHLLGMPRNYALTLKKIEKVLPCTYNEDTIIDLLKKYYQEINTCIPMNEEQKDLLEVIKEIFG